MLTRKEALFIKPFQERLYCQHKTKLKSATARVDTKSPQEWNHVVKKQKKLQKEKERCTQIYINNSILWQHLNNIMSTRRVDNHWKYQQPKFFHRVKLFNKQNNKLTIEIDDQAENNKSLNHLTPLEIKKENCSACNPRLIINKTNLPEERIPWEPAKKKLSKKLQSLSFQKDNFENEKRHLVKQKTKGIVINEKKKIITENNIKVKNKLTIETSNYVNCIEIKEGCLDLVIKYPPKSKVTMKDGIRSHILQANN
ncbi:uncharacterized protein LOC126898573 [Daktulosphaira vitifoliae]|uniref:uncharacterized protein LOC126898573 n=1 Tax=Daktulosphaira vitifoliae TaxID=58002 RepID=UPI0021A9BB78|nr:uncharacterized protein LOC126898573 [Daktulosphaira vitifoliae]XP_050528731.1 uncharacterized protein LOC126898573 [Daktulosphaira vitifoliae]XP_050528732.1 uncharacterized protein LOC126898573 [Daktulosphaira vitifoliae]